jgi:hypothetical protein
MNIRQPERVTQNRLIALFRDELDKQIEGVFTCFASVGNGGSFLFLP